MSESQAVWYIPNESHQPLGPFTAEQVLEQYRSGKVESTTVCWKEGMTKWEPLNTVEPFATELAKAEASAKKRWKKIVVLLLLVFGVIAGLAVGYWLIMGPAEVRRANKLMSKGLYTDAAEVLETYLKARPDNYSAVYLLAIAKLDAYATAQTSDSDWEAILRGSDLGDNVQSRLKKAIAMKPSWDKRAREDTAKAASLVSVSQKDSIDRLLAISKLRAELKLENEKVLAGQMMEHARSKYGSYEGQEIRPDVVSQILIWDSSLSGQVVELLLGSSKVPLAQFANGARGLQYSMSQLPKSVTEAVAKEVLRQASDMINQVKYDYAEVLLETAAQLDKDRPDEAAMLYVKAARSAKDTDTASAQRFVGKALKLNPEVADNNEDDTVLCLEFSQADEMKMKRCQTFLRDYPAGERRGKVLLITIVDAVKFFDSHQGWARNENVPVYLRLGHESAKELLDKYGKMNGVDTAVFDLANRLAKNNQVEDVEDAANLVSRLLEMVPDTALRPQIEELISECEGDNLPLELRPLAKRVKAELREVTLVSPTSLSAILANPGSVRVIRISDDCTLNEFSDDHKRILLAWVENGGILWANNDVLSLFGIRFSYSDLKLGGGSHVCVPAVTAESCPIMTKCDNVAVYLDSRSSTAYNIECPNVVPLLNISRDSRRGTQSFCCWSLVKYGRGWVSNVKNIEKMKHSGARFWLNFRLFLLGEDIPGAKLSTQEYVKRISSGAPPPPPPKELDKVKIVSTADELRQALADGNNCKVLWVRLPQLQTGIDNLRMLRDWVRGGGVLWVETDLARSFNFEKIEKPLLVKGKARVVLSGHPLTEDIVGKFVGYELGANGVVISGRFSDISQGRAKLVLVQQTEKKDVVNCVCAVGDYGKGYVILRPSTIDTNSEEGKRFDKNIRSFSFKTSSLENAVYKSQGDEGDHRERGRTTPDEYMKMMGGK